MNIVYENIRHFYKGKNILITGSTGFLGTYMVEKFLRSFPQVNRLYLLIRMKENKTAEERRMEYFNKKIFAKLKDINPNFTSKVVFVSATTSRDNILGLSASQMQELRENVNIVFHCAAITEFNWPLKQILETNLKGTNDVLNIFKDSTKIDSFVHVSTLYSYFKPERFESYEKIYPPFADVEEVLKMVDTLSKDELKERLMESRKKSMNNYMYSKNLAENLVALRKGSFPIGIFRPGVVLASYQEPFPYWIQGSSSFEIVLKEIEKGLIYQFPYPSQSACVPVDLTANALIAVAHDIYKNGDKLTVYNYGASNKNPITFQKLLDYFVGNPFNWSTLTSRLWYNVWLPFYGIFNSKSEDVINRHRFFIIYKKIAKLYTEREYYMENENVRKVWKDLTEEDRRLLFSNLDDIDWKTYYGNMFHGRIEDKA